MRESKRDETQEAIRRALGLAIQILEDLPDWLQPASDMDDMRVLLKGGNNGNDGRDNLILITAVSLALAWRTRQATTMPVSKQGFVNQLEEFRTLFTIVHMCDPWTFAIKFVEACGRFSCENETN